MKRERRYRAYTVKEAREVLPRIRLYSRRSDRELDAKRGWGVCFLVDVIDDRGRVWLDRYILIASGPQRRRIWAGHCVASLDDLMNDLEFFAGRPVGAINANSHEEAIEMGLIPVTIDGAAGV